MRSRSRAAALAATLCFAGMLASCAYQQQPYAQYPAQGYPGQSAPAYRGQPVPGYATYPDQRGTEYGTVSSIEGLQPHNRTTGVGAILGAVVGGVLGNQIGGGTGRAAATAIGAVGGAVAGNAIEGQQGNRSGYEAYRITVQLDQGGQRVYEVPTPGDLRPGDRVRLYQGQIARM